MWSSGKRLESEGNSPPGKKSKGCTPPASDNSILNEALESCRNHEIGIQEASLIYGIPKKTLKTKLKDTKTSCIDENYKVFVLFGYPAEAETDLVGYMEDCLASQVTFTIAEVRRLAYELVREKYNVDARLPRNKNCILGQRWYKKFVEKYPHLDLRNHPVKYDIKSVDFYNTLEIFINKFKISDSQIYSVDEIELKFLATCVEDMKVFFHKRRTIYTNAKAICCMNPVGDFLPPIFLKVHYNDTKKYPKFSLDFQEGDSDKNQRETISRVPTANDLLNVEKELKMHVNIKEQPMSEEDEEKFKEKLYSRFARLRNKVILKSENSAEEIMPDVFYNWFVSFINHVNPTPERKVLLLLSDQNHVKSFKVLELAQKHGVVFVILPSHAIHKIHPLDGFALSLNRNLSTCARRWLGKNPEFKLQQVPLHVLFMEAFSETINPLIAKNGFLYSGIWPINRDVFESSELGGESALHVNKSVVSDSSLMATTDMQRSNISIAGITSQADIGKLCRVCMKEKMYMKPLLEPPPSSLPNYHGAKFSEIIKVPVSPEDDLPSFLCQYCLVELIDTIKIRETAVKSHKKQLRLKEALNGVLFKNEEGEDQEFKCFFQWATTHINDSKLLNKILSRNFDMNSVCRICMLEKPLMTSIFLKSQGGTILYTDVCNKITEVSEFEVHFHDGLSSSICPFCRTSIGKAAEFIQKALSSNKILREIILHFKGGFKMEFKTEAV